MYFNTCCTLNSPNQNGTPPLGGAPHMARGRDTARLGRPAAAFGHYNHITGEGRPGYDLTWY